VGGQDKCADGLLFLLEKFPNGHELARSAGFSRASLKVHVITKVDPGPLQCAIKNEVDEVAC
jgi:hypothetical protein